MYQAKEDRYEKMKYNRTGTSGLLLPALSLGLWHNFGDTLITASPILILPIITVLHMVAPREISGRSLRSISPATVMSL